MGALKLTFMKMVQLLGDFVPRPPTRAMLLLDRTGDPSWPWPPVFKALRRLWLDRQRDKTTGRHRKMMRGRWIESTVQPSVA